jgi:hypothetical protein
MATTQYKLKIEERGVYVFACVETRERIGSDRDPTYLQRIAEHCARCRCTSILIEKHTPETFDVWDAFAIAPKLAGIGHDEIRVALVEKGAPLPARDELTVAIGDRRGLSVHIFGDNAAAEDWLRSSRQESGLPGPRPIPIH